MSEEKALKVQQILSDFKKMAKEKNITILTCVQSSPKRRSLSQDFDPCRIMIIDYVESPSRPS